MSNTEQSKTASQKVNSFLQKNKKGLIIFVIVVLVLLAGFYCYQVFSAKQTENNLSKIDAISYKLITDTKDMTEGTELNDLLDTALTDLAEYTKKSGAAGVRANMISAEIAYQKNDYAAAASYWDAAAVKGKKAYTTALCEYNKAVCYEQANDYSKAADSYKAASETAGFLMATHAAFNYGRVLEHNGSYAEAVAVYEDLNSKHPSDDWAKLAKSRILSLKAEGKAE